ncbi:MAG: GNAT family N-acetyltransferase [Nitrososphaeria archaeon]
MEFEVKQTGSVFYIRLPDNSKAYLKYKIEDNIMYLIETYTPPAYRGIGLAKMMIDKAVEYAAKENLKIIPECSYAIKYFIKNNDKYRELLADKYKSMSIESLEEYYRQRLEYEKQKSGIE